MTRRKEQPVPIVHFADPLHSLPNVEKGSYYYEDIDGERHQSSMERNNELYWSWVQDPQRKLYNSDTHTIYTFGTPLTQEDWMKKVNQHRNKKD